MDEKKQIEELSDFLWHNTLIHTEDLCHDVAETVIIEGYRKQSVGEWVNNHCSICGMMPIGDEIFKYLDITPPRFDLFMNFCPNCGARMGGGAE